MRYEKYKESPYEGMYKMIAKWCNQPNFFKKTSLREFCVVVKEANKNKTSVVYDRLIKFENKYPDIAKEYFDLKFEDFIGK
jgi:hypothetical protein